MGMRQTLRTERAVIQSVSICEHKNSTQNFSECEGKWGVLALSLVFEKKVRRNALKYSL